MARTRLVSAVVATAVALAWGGVPAPGASSGRAVVPAEVQFPTPEAAPRAGAAGGGVADVAGAGVAASAFSDGLLRRTVTIADPRESASPSDAQRVKKGIVELRYANGKKERMSIAIEHDVRGKPSPAGAGVVLGLTNFYFQD